MNDLEQCGHLCWTGSTSSRSFRVETGSAFRLKDCNLFSMDSGSGSVCAGALPLLLGGTLISVFNLSLRLVLKLVLVFEVVLVGGGLDTVDDDLLTSFELDLGCDFLVLGTVDDGGGVSLTTGLAGALE